MLNKEQKDCILENLILDMGLETNKEVKQLQKLLDRTMTVGDLLDNLKGVSRDLPIELSIITKVEGTTTTSSASFLMSSMDCGGSYDFIRLEAVEAELVDAYIRHEKMLDDDYNTYMAKK